LINFQLATEITNRNNHLLKKRKNMKKIIFTSVMLLFCFLACWGQEIVPQPKKTIRIMSYNIRNCVGMDNKKDIDRVSNVITRAKPDVIALQELDSMTQRSNNLDVLHELAQRTQMYPVFAAAIDFQGGKYGIGMLSKKKPLSSFRMALPGREEKRVFLLVEFKEYYVACVHFSLTAEDQETSAKMIIEKLRQIKTQKPIFLAGDINSEYASKTQDILRNDFVLLSDYRQKTIPSTQPDQCIDYIYQLSTKRTMRPVNQVVIYGCQASDHLPIFVDLKK
jgi:endonuclease/exonuclease/phosphatase family metal-dependent hydrolase